MGIWAAASATCDPVAQLLKSAVPPLVIVWKEHKKTNGCQTLSVSDIHGSTHLCTMYRYRMPYNHAVTGL